MNGCQDQVMSESAQNVNRHIGTVKGRPRIWTRERILTKISEIHKNGIVSSCRCGPVLPAAIRQFGSWRNACAAAGYKATSDKTIYTTCTAGGCKNEVRSRTEPYCEKHYGRIRRNGNLKGPVRIGEFIGSDGYKHKNCIGHELQKKSRHWIREHRAILYDKIGPGRHSCYWCRKEVDFDLSYPKHLDGLVVDHLDENKLNNNPENLVASCAVCNSKRGRKKMIETSRRRRARWIEFRGENKTLGEWADKVGTTKAGLEYRLRNWTLNRALTEAKGNTGPKRKCLCYGAPHGLQRWERDE